MIKKITIFICFFIMMLPLNVWAKNNIKVSKVKCENISNGEIRGKYNAKISNNKISTDDGYFSKKDDNLKCSIKIKNLTMSKLSLDDAIIHNMSDDNITYSLDFKGDLAPLSSKNYELLINLDKEYEDYKEIENNIKFKFNGSSIVIKHSKGDFPKINILFIVLILIGCILFVFFLRKKNIIFRLLIIILSIVGISFIVILSSNITITTEDSVSNEYLISLDNKITFYVPREVVVKVDRNELSENSEFNLFLEYDRSDFVEGKPKYIINHFANEIGADSDRWNDALEIEHENENYRVNFSGDNLDAGVYYVHVLTEYKNGMKVENCSSKVHVSVDETVRTNDLNKLASSLSKREKVKVSSNNILLDFIQPWIYSGQPRTIIEKDLMLLKRAGYNGVVLQYVFEVDSDGSNNIIPKAAFYDSKIYPDKVEGDVLGDLLISAEKVGMDVYFGGVYGYDWWKGEKISSADWNSKYANFTVKIMQELYSLYGSNSCFKGWYWTNEMYTSDQGLESLWVNHLNTVLNYINGLSDRKPIIISPFISSAIIVDSNTVRNQWNAIINNLNLKSGDTIAFQDGFGNTEYPVDEIWDFLSIIRNIVKKKNNNIYFALDLENFVGTTNISGAASINRLNAQKNVGKYIADYYCSFSYVHYYSPYQTNTITKAKNSNAYDKAYRAGLGQNVSNDSELISISAPSGGYVFVDSDGLEAPIPRGFTVSSNASENTIKSGLVIRDVAGNEFVWVPVFYGIRDNGYSYLRYQAYGAAYARYLNNGLGSVNIADVSSDSLPSGVASEYAQINKYGGFYIGRYESSLLYEEGIIKTAVKRVDDSKADLVYYPEYVVDDNHNGKMMLNVNYEVSKNFAEKMSSDYGYDSTVKTGLINGREWDTASKWIEVSDWNLYKTYDGRAWGNYIDSIGAAVGGNYLSGTLRGTGSNEAWKARNIYDLSGNLREWTSDVVPGGNKVIRGVAFDGDGEGHSGLNGGVSYNVSSPSYGFSNVGYRVVLYIS